MYDYPTLKALIDQRLQAYDPPLRATGLRDAIRHSLLSAGKRVRPVLTLMAANLWQDDIDKAVDLALAIEVLHNFTLLHDDLLDQAELRRNEPTVATLWSPDIALLSGDAMSILAVGLARRCAGANCAEVLDFFLETALHISEGELIDMSFETRNDVSCEEYMEMIGLKTAALLAASCRIGCMAVDAVPEVQEALECFGCELGLAFQLRDDLLDIYGSANNTGKRVGGDIIANKKTYPLLMGLERAGAEDRQALSELLSSKSACMDNDAKVDAVRAILDRYEVKEACGYQADRHLATALETLSDLRVPAERKKPLQGFVAMLAKRMS